LTLTREQLSERAVKGHITRKLRLNENDYDNYKQLSESIVNLRESKSLSSIKEMYQNMGMTTSAVALITKKLKDDDKDDIIDDYDEDVDDTEFQQVFLINNNANIPAGTWVKYEPMYLWVKKQWFVLESFEKSWAKYSQKASIQKPKANIMGEKDFEKYDKRYKKSYNDFRDGFLKNVTFAIIQSIHKNGSEQKYRTYTDKETGKLVKVQHFNGSEPHWMEPRYKELYKDVNEYGYEEV
jgi:hypothetical protein